MSRKKFIEKQGATCRSWMWSWSFVNHDKKFIIFGAWDNLTAGSESVIFNEDWERGPSGRKRSAYPEAREHIRLVEEEGYALKIFPMIYSDERKNEQGQGPSKIAGFIPELTSKQLVKRGREWVATDDATVGILPEELDTPPQYPEGAQKSIVVNAYERNPEARSLCLKAHGYSCKVCGFDFTAMYGDIGKDYVHVHHKIPLSSLKKTYHVNPINDLVPVCPNCHAILHRKRPAYTIDELKEIIENHNRTGG